MSKIFIEDNYSEYRKTVAVFCYYLSGLAHFAKLKRQGEELNNDTFEHFINCSKEYRSRLLKIKEAQEIPGGISFLEDANFNGFKIQGGEISGDFKFADAITKPWLTGFPDTSNFYQFEVGCYIQMLIHPDCLSGQIPFSFVLNEDVSEEVATTTIKKGGLREWTRRLHSKSSALVQAVQAAIS